MPAILAHRAERRHDYGLCPRRRANPSPRPSHATRWCGQTLVPPPGLALPSGRDVRDPPLRRGTPPPGATRARPSNSCALHNRTCVWHNDEVKPLRFSRSARKHRIGRDSARYVIANYLPDESRLVSGDVKRSWTGLDERGRELEIVAFERPDCWLVVHVMPTHYRRRKP